MKMEMVDVGSFSCVKRNSMIGFVQLQSFNFLLNQSDFMNPKQNQKLTKLNSSFTIDIFAGSVWKLEKLFY